MEKSGSMTGTAPPRIYCLSATAAPVLAVFRRGPSRWSHVGRWDLAAGRYEHGAWLHGRIFPRRSDISPDGRLLCYFAHKPTATWELGDAYVAVSKLPWLTALHAFATCGTWTRGYHFTEEKGDEGVVDLPGRYRLRSTPVVQFANERRRGWEEAADSPARHANDVWDQHRNARMLKREPGGDRVLRVESIGWAGGEFGVEQAVDGMRVQYSLEMSGEVELLDDLQWADWDRSGRMVVATRSGRLQVRRLDRNRPEIVFEADLSVLEPSPGPSPDWAQGW